LHLPSLFLGILVMAMVLVSMALRWQALKLRLEQDTIRLQTQVELLGQRHQQEEQVELLAHKVLLEQGRVMREQHSEGLSQLLGPMREQLADFKKRVEENHTQDLRDRITLLKEIELLRSLNEGLSREAAELTTALQGSSKMQGVWGEMILERILEESGLRPGKEFATQVSHRDEQGKLKQPDVLLYLPENRVVIIDSKVSLKSYLAACRSTDAKEQGEHVKQHLLSIQKHISSLSSKQYQNLPGLTSLDFVLLFMPVEGAFQMAVSTKPELLSEALQRRVVLTSPSTLFAILRTIHHLWRIDEQNRNSETIAQEAGKLYDKLVGFMEAFTEIGTRLDQAQQSWNLADKRLRSGQGNLLQRAENLKGLGVQSSKDL
jgi:DNA recombination protein RmuC